MENDYDISAPKPTALIESLRSVGYSLSTAIADLLDNSISAGAKTIWINFHWSGPASKIEILDDGAGMTELALVEAMRPGSSSPIDRRKEEDLGRFGLGLKTASFSQCRKLTVWSKSSGSSVVGRCWDLDYVSKHDEWRLRKCDGGFSSQYYERLKNQSSGTLVIWNSVDRLVDESPTESGEAHAILLNRIEEVRQHLSMTFHRYLSAKTSIAGRSLKIFINGHDEIHQVKPWNPFSIEGAPPSKEFPVEIIKMNGEKIEVKGYILPHKDRLTEEQHNMGAGPKGWTAQQGFYIYRNDRMLLSGSWLKLGRGKKWAKDEQYKLARLSIDIPNSMDQQWSLDVKKSEAWPPPTMRERLTGLGEAVRLEARKVFLHRGEYGARAGSPAAVIEKPWNPVTRNGRLAYLINRKHPLIAGVLGRFSGLESEIEPLLRLIEETVPVQRIWLDTAEGDTDHAIPYENYDERVVMEDIRKAMDFLRSGMSNTSSLRAFLLASEPFNRYPELVEKVVAEG